MYEAESPWLTPKEAAKYLRVSERTLQSWRTQQAGPKYFKNKQTLRYDKQDLDVWMRQSREIGTGGNLSYDREKEELRDENEMLLNEIGDLIASRDDLLDELEYVQRKLDEANTR